MKFEVGVIFSGGLGDCLLQCYLTERYISLNKFSKIAVISCCKINSFIEVFDYHPNKDNFIIYNYNHLFHSLFRKGEKNKGEISLGEYIDIEAIKFANLPLDLFNLNNITNFTESKKPIFYSNSNEYLEKDYGVIHPFSNNVIKNPDINIFKEYEKIYSEKYDNVYIIGRNLLKENFEVHYSNSKFLNELTVPQTIHLIKNAKEFVGTESSLAHIANLENIKGTICMKKKHYDENKDHFYIKRHLNAKNIKIEIYE